MATKKQRTRHYRLIFCLALSIFIWFAVQMSKNYTQTYQFGIKFVNMPTGKSLSYQSDSIVSVTVNAKGVSLLKYEFGRKKVKVDYISMATAEQRRRNYVTIKKNQLNTYLIKQLDFPENSVINQPSVITLEFEATSK
jgi:hypothetical protein